MKRARFTEEQIIAVLKEHEAGAKTADLARKHGIRRRRKTGRGGFKTQIPRGLVFHRDQSLKSSISACEMVTRISGSSEPTSGSSRAAPAYFSLHDIQWSFQIGIPKPLAPCASVLPLKESSGPLIGARSDAKVRRIMNSKLPEDYLQPVIEALAPTSLGRPKTQAVFNEFVDRFEAMLERGYTYKDIADALNRGGASGRMGAFFTAGSLYNRVERAREHERDRGSGTFNRAGKPKRDHLQRPTTTPSQPKVLSTNDSSQPQLRKFMLKIGEAKAHAATDKILIRGKLNRS
jgi:hypothetical protein